MNGEIGKGWYRLLAGCVLFLFVILGNAAAQRQTEMYIPVGESPGLSGTATLLGEIRSVNSQEQSMRIETEHGTQHVKVTAKTKIWLDRSALKLPSKEGKFQDCYANVRAEVKLVDQKSQNEKIADWVKLEVLKE